MHGSTIIVRSGTLSGQLRFAGSGLLFLLALVFLAAPPAAAARIPRLLLDAPPKPAPMVGWGGLTAKYKRVSGPLGFGGDMLVWGLRGAGGNLVDPKLGAMAAVGVLNGTALRMDLKMAGLSVERGFKTDGRVKWRATFGGGTYQLKSQVTTRIINQGSFTFVEPMIIGLHPLTRHIAAEFGLGYTFAGTTGVRLEGICLEVDLLLGRF